MNQELKTALATDINVACAMLEAISFSDLAQTGMAPSGLANIYLDVCFTTSATEPRTVALEGLASLMDKLLSHTPDDSTLSALPTEETLFALWSDIHQKPINPALSDAIIRVSGPLLATSLIRARGQVDENLARRLSSWGTMMSDAGVSDRVSPLETHFYYFDGREDNVLTRKTDIRYSYSFRRSHQLIDHQY